MLANEANVGTSRRHGVTFDDQCDGATVTDERKLVLYRNSDLKVVHLYSGCLFFGIARERL